MAFNGHTIIDGDGHVIEECKAIINYMPQPYRDKYDTHPFLQSLSAAWITCTRPTCTIFNRAHLTKSAPTVGWTFWKMSASRPPCFTRPWASPSARSSAAIGPSTSRRAYNDWLYDTYLKRSPRFKGMGFNSAAGAAGRSGRAEKNR